MTLPEAICKRLVALAKELALPRASKLLIAPMKDEAGYGFGAGNCIRYPRDGSLLLIGRYQNGEKRKAGKHPDAGGEALSIFRSTNQGRSFERVAHWPVEDFSKKHAVLSIGGSALRLTQRGIQVLVSTELDVPVPKAIKSPGKLPRGIWRIQAFEAAEFGKLDPSRKLNPMVLETDPAHLHIKDPSVSSGFNEGQDILFYSTQPFSKSSSNSGYAWLLSHGVEHQSNGFFQRGPVWDVAETSISCRLPVPRVGPFANLPPISLYFYNGAERVHHDPASTSHPYPPWGYAGEQQGGIAYGFDRDFPSITRLTKLAPLFSTSKGTGACRHIRVLAEQDGSLFATWQQSSNHGAQALHAHRLTASKVAKILAS